MRTRFLSAPSAALPSTRPTGAAAAAALHAAGIGVLLLLTAGARLTPPTGSESASPLVVMVPRPESLPLPVLVVSGPLLEAVEAMPPAAAFTTAEGFTYDTSRIRQQREVLFPFLSGRLPFLDDLRHAAAAERQRLHNPLGAVAAGAGQIGRRFS